MNGSAAPLLGEPLAVELMNTVWADRDGIHDGLADRNGVAEWIVGVGDRFADLDLDSLVVSSRLAAEYRRLRDALRTLAALATDDHRDHAPTPADRELAIATVNRACRYGRTWSQLSWPAAERPHRTVVSNRTPAGNALSLIAEQAVMLLAGADRPRLRACPGPGCRLYFVRRHPRREWCSPQCGNRARVGRHYYRHHVQAEGGSLPTSARTRRSGTPAR
jgi:predicted RNA-binding Zn ribbon-like protein